MPISVPSTEAVRVRVTSAGTQSLQEQRITPARYSLIDHQTNRITSMSSLDVPNGLARIDPAVEREFNALTERWRMETRQLSSDSDIAGKFAYHQIIGMGERVLPLIFRELQERGGRWYWALRAITRQNPVRPEERGNVRRMTDVWLQWGRDQGYV